MTTPVKLNLGCGHKRIEGYIGVDGNGDWPAVDVKSDLRKLPYPSNSVDEWRGKG